MKAPSKNSGTHHVFLSYAAADKSAAEKLRRLLSARDDVSVSTVEDLTTGTGWKTRLRNALEQCDVFSLLLTPNTLSSNSVLQELGAAWALNKRIVPVLSGGQAPGNLPVTVSNLQYRSLEALQSPADLNDWVPAAA